MAEVAYRLEKPVFFVNGILSDCPVTGRNEGSLSAAATTLERCKGVYLRDPRSVEYAAETMPSVPCRYLPDALFTFLDRVQDRPFRPPAVGDFAIPHPEERRWLGRLDFSKPYVCVSGSSLAAYDQERAVHSFRTLVEEVQGAVDLPVYLVPTCWGDRFLEGVAEECGGALVPKRCPVFLLLAIIAGSEVFISGRYHPSIAAALGNTPSVFLAAHSHKIHSLRDRLGYEDEPVHPAHPGSRDVEAIVDRVRTLLSGGNEVVELRERIRAAVRNAAAAAQTTPAMIEQALQGSRSQAAEAVQRPPH